MRTRSSGATAAVALLLCASWASGGIASAQAIPPELSPIAEQVRRGEVEIALASIHALAEPAR
nr:hypothetical protein [Myxococcota bacterium]